MRVRVVQTKHGYIVERFDGYHKAWVEEKKFEQESEANRYANKIRSDKRRDAEYDTGYN